jgi:hypothetical protein
MSQNNDEFWSRFAPNNPENNPGISLTMMWQNCTWACISTWILLTASNLWQNCTWGMAIDFAKGLLSGILGGIIMNFIVWLIWLMEPASFNLNVTDVASGLIFGFILGYWIQTNWWRYPSPLRYLVNHTYRYGLAVLVLLALMWQCGLVVDTPVCAAHIPMRAFNFPVKMWIC